MCRVFVAVVSLLVSGFACSRASDPPKPRSEEASTRIASWREDLRALGDELPRLHHDPFFHTSETTFRRELAALDASIPTATDAQIITGLVRIVASLGDSHTAVRLVNRGGVYPLALYDFSDGLYVVGAPDDHAWAVGARLVGVGNHSVEQARAVLAPLIAHDNDAGVRGALPATLVQPILLAGAGLAPDDHHVTYRLALADGTTRELALEPAITLPPLAPPKTLPLYIQQPRSPYWKTYDPAHHLLYVKYNQCRDADPPIAAFLASLIDDLQQKKVERLVIDMRHNGGGNSALFDPFIVWLAQHRDAARHVYAVIGRATFSSAVLNAIALHRAGAILVGEPTAGKPSHHGEVQLFALPRSGLVITYSTKFFANPDFVGDALQPAVPAATTYADWASGRDPVLEAILAR